MKENMKFLSLVLAVLLLSLSILTGCMFGIGADRGEEKPYDTESGVRPGLTGEDAPISQAEMQEKFYGMYEISEDETSITVISPEYLSEYWDFQTETVRSLTVEEVLFIIQDSIRIYETYETIIMPGFASPYGEDKKADWYPRLTEQVITREGEIGRETARADIYDMIRYRLSALSSPKAFITGYEALAYIGSLGHSSNAEAVYPSSVFYIPAYSSEADREALLEYFDAHPFDLTVESLEFDFFNLSAWGTDTIRIYSKSSKGQIFPTDELGPKVLWSPVPNIVDGQFVWNEAQFPTIKNIKIGPNTLTNPNPTEEEIANFLCQALYYFYSVVEDYRGTPYLIPYDETRALICDDVYYPLDRSYIKDRQYMQSVIESFFYRSEDDYGFNTDNWLSRGFLDEEVTPDDVWTVSRDDRWLYDWHYDPSIINFAFKGTYGGHIRIYVYVYEQHNCQNEDGETESHACVDIEKFSLIYTNEGLWKLARYSGSIDEIYGYNTTLRDDYGTRLTIEKAN